MFERYTLILRHELILTGDSAVQLEEPFVMNWIVDKTVVPNSGVVINEMMERFKLSVLQKYGG